MIIEKSPDLMARPMLLTYIDDLLDKDDESLCITDIYKELIEKWLKREQVEYELLKKFTHNVVMCMLSNNLRFLTNDHILKLCKKEEIEIINPILARTRSLLVRNGSGEYKFAHYSIYEYLISYMAVYEDSSIREEILKMDNSFNRKYFCELSYKQLLSGDKNLQFLDFSGLVLENINLSNADLFNANFEKTVLKNVCLDGAKLQKANLKDAKFYQGKLRKANLAGARLIGADLTGADLTGADLKCAKLDKSNLKNVKIKDIEIDKESLQYINANFKDIFFGLKYTAIDTAAEEQNDI